VVIFPESSNHSSPHIYAPFEPARRAVSVCVAPTVLRPLRKVSCGPDICPTTAQAADHRRRSSALEVASRRPSAPPLCALPRVRLHHDGGYAHASGVFSAPTPRHIGINSSACTEGDSRCCGHAVESDWRRSGRLVSARQQRAPDRVSITTGPAVPVSRRIRRRSAAACPRGGRVLEVRSRRITSASGRTPVRFKPGLKSCRPSPPG